MSYEVMPQWLTKRAHLTPNRTALVYKRQRLSFRELYEKVVEMSQQLSANGVQPHDFVAVLLKNHVDTVVILFALQLLGAKTVMLNTRLTAEELSFQIQDSRSSLLITESEFQSVLSNLAISTKLVFKETLCLSESVLVSAIDEVSLEDVCSVMYTSGTTGNPKGVLQTYGNHWWSAVGSALNLGLHEQDTWLCAVPLFHISGYSILMRSVIYGMKVILHDGFDPEQVNKALVEENVTIMSVVSTMLHRLIEVIKEPLPTSFRCMLLGGGPAPLSLLESCKLLGIPVYQTYGMTETASQVVTLSPEDSIRKLGSAGKPLFPIKLKIVNEQHVSCEPLESGEIWLKGANVTKGYLHSENSAHLTEDGWFSTGDIGYCDEEGFLYVLDRRSDLIISGGENIYPAEIEGVLLSHPSVLEAGVVGRDDPEWGQVPVAFVVSKPGAVNEQELVVYCQTRLAKYKVPKQVIFVQELPRNASQKLLRRTLKDWLKGGRLEGYEDRQG